MKKILIIRFSSIGDIVLTTPIVRALKSQVADVEIHYLTKSQFTQILDENPFIDKVIGLNKRMAAIIPSLKSENYDFIVDLHKNLRTYRIKAALRKPSGSFPKLNFKKYILTRFKKDTLPKIHIVARYFKAVHKLGVKDDNKGLNYFIPQNNIVDPVSFGISLPYTAIAIGAQFATKRLPTHKLIELINQIQGQVVILGGPTDEKSGKQITEATKNSINLCGKLNLNESASVIQQAQLVISHDTGLMHIAAAFNKRIISIWGNTVPEFGMYPYLPESSANSVMFQVTDLKCRPCSKIGHAQCPKGHFNCMNQQNISEIAATANGLID